MDLETLRDALGWCTLINISFLLIWSALILFASDFVYRLHSKMIPVDRERFNAIHYAGIACYNVAIFVFNLAPYLALRIVG